jgi:iron-sulfur cluster insertion protein
MGETLETQSVGMTASAAKRVATMIAQDGGSGLMLRVSVSGGGCSGFQYGFSFDDTVNADDRTFERDGVTLVVDEVSLDLLAGSEVDYVEEGRLRGGIDRRLVPDQQPPGDLVLRLRLVVFHLTRRPSPSPFYALV